MDAQCQESAVALKHFQNIADFDVVCTALGIDNIEVAFFRPETLTTNAKTVIPIP